MNAAAVLAALVYDQTPAKLMEFPQTSAAVFNAC